MDDSFSGWPAIGRQVYANLIAPRSTDPERRRRELIVHLLIAGVMGAAVIAAISSLVTHLFYNHDNDWSGFAALLVFQGLAAGLWHYSLRRGATIVAAVLVALVAATGAGMAVWWGFALPQAQLTLALAIVLAGILFKGRVVLWFLGGMAGLVLTLSYIQSSGRYQPDSQWLHEPFVFGDAIGYVVVFAVIGLVSWISNRELFRSLERARLSEAALVQERDSLEEKVAARTRELEQAQLQHLVELQRFAEFGRLSAGLFHDMANPLTAASLSLQQAADAAVDQHVNQALTSLRQIDRYVVAARQQLRGGGTAVRFNARAELSLVVDMLAGKARSAHVRIELAGPPACYIVGDAVKFSQITANLLANAIEAYPLYHAASSVRGRRVRLVMRRRAKGIELTCTDWGSGLRSDQQAHLFEPFYTTKAASGRGMGIGLAMVKQFVENDFGGSVDVHSSPRDGTCFQLYLYDARAALSGGAEQ